MLRDEAALFLRQGLDGHSDLLSRRAPRDLLYQCTVQCWTAFEVLANDLIAFVCDARPEEFARRIIADDKAKRRFDRKWTLEDLSESSFKLSNCLLDAVLGHAGLSDFPSIHRALVALAPALGVVANQELFKRLETLAEKRHLIVHRGGRMDRRFLERSRYLPLECEGLDLPVSSDELEADFNCVRVLGRLALERVEAEFVVASQR
jgi:hypothetical protein